jgi:hypothetical protein
MLKANVALYFSGSRALMTGPLLSLSEFVLLLALTICEFELAFELAFAFAFEFGIGWQALMEIKSITPSASEQVF